MSKSKLQLAWEELQSSDPGWYATVIPVAGCAGRVALCAVREDPYIPGRKMHGRVFAEYWRRNDAEKAAKILNERKANH